MPTIVDIYTTPGDLSINPPVGAYMADFEAIGGGAAGAVNGVGGEGRGGGGGGYGKTSGVTVAHGTLIPAHVGASAPNNTAGDSSWIGAQGTDINAVEGLCGVGVEGGGFFGQTGNNGGFSQVAFNAEPAYGGGGGAGPIGPGDPTSIPGTPVGTGGTGDGGTAAGGVFGIGAPNGSNSPNPFGGGGGGASGVDTDDPMTGGTGGLYGGGGGQGAGLGVWLGGTGQQGALRITWYTRSTASVQAHVY